MSESSFTLKPMQILCVVGENGLRTKPWSQARTPLLPLVPRVWGRQLHRIKKHTRWGEKSIFEESQSAFEALYGTKAHTFQSDGIINASMDNNKAVGVITNMRRCQIQIRELSFVPVRLQIFYRIDQLENTRHCQRMVRGWKVTSGTFLTVDVASDCLFIHSH